METEPKTLHSCAENARKEEEAVLCFSHSAVPHSGTLPPRWLMIKAALGGECAGLQAKQDGAAAARCGEKREKLKKITLPTFYSLFPVILT